MNLKSIKITCFRNLAFVEALLAPGMTVFVGSNGQGKTNLLDAISLALQLRPLRAVRQTSDLIQFGQTHARIQGEFDNTQVQVDLTPDGKKVKINGKPTRDSQALAEKVSVVSFVPEDLGAVLGGAALRRLLLDQASASLSPNYVLYYRQYDRVLTQRNRLLKQPLLDFAEFASFTEVLSGLAAQLERLRMEALKTMTSYFTQAMHQLSSGQLLARLDYAPTSKGDLKAVLAEASAEERARKTTIRGPHLDDLDIVLNGYPARFTASRGQARLIVLALKIAQLQAVYAERGLKPVLLLDDIVGELDPHHAGRLLETIMHLEAQTLVTTTHLSMLPNGWLPSHVFEIQEGAFKPESDPVL